MSCYDASSLLPSFRICAIQCSKGGFCGLPVSKEAGKVLLYSCICYISGYPEYIAEYSDVHFRSQNMQLGRWQMDTT